MSFAQGKRSRSERVSRHVAPRDSHGRWRSWLRDPQIVQRIGFALLAALLMWGGSGAWAPSFSYRTGYVPPRDIVAHTKFNRPDPKETEARQRQVRSETLMVYQHDVQPLIELRKALKNQVFQIIRSESLDEINPNVWREFLDPRTESDPSARRRLSLPLPPCEPRWRTTWNFPDSKGPSRKPSVITSETGCWRIWSIRWKRGAKARSGFIPSEMNRISGDWRSRMCGLPRPPRIWRTG
jgi:hypothetical protein